MKFNKPIKKQKTSAQAMVEFAIALPVLLLLLYGLLETGRYLFLYSTVVNASRQAVRYGSATGPGDNFTSIGGPNNSNVTRYQDCFGIRRAATRSAYIATFDTITIQWDEGPADVTPTTYCSGNSDTSLTSTILGDNAHRISVTVEEPYTPLVPRLVPFVARTITATSSRTILLSVSIEVTAATTLVGNTPIPPTFTFTPSSTPVTPSPTDTPTPTFTPVTLTPTATITPSITPVPPTATNTGTATNTPLPPTATNTPTATATDVPNCNATTLQHGSETIPNNSNQFTMNIRNSTTTSLTIKDITVHWNHDLGGKSNSDPRLFLTSVYLDVPSSVTDVLVWSQTPGVNSPSLNIIPSNIPLEVGTSKIIFNFDQVYQNKDTSERIIITLANNGCTSVFIDSDTTPSIP